MHNYVAVYIVNEDPAKECGCARGDNKAFL